MNTITTQETFALVAAIPVQSMLLVPLSQLRPSKRKNVRKTAGAPITALAASIERVGLLQNLTVAYEVLDGFARVREHRDAMRAVTLHRREAEVFAHAALALKYDDPAKPAPITEAQLLTPSPP